MVRIADLAAAHWARPPAPAARAESLRPSDWFDDAVAGELRIAGDPGAVRGLSVEQHAARVLQCLRGDAEPRP